MRSTRRLAAGTALAFVALAGSFGIAQTAGAHDGPHEEPTPTAEDLTPGQRHAIRRATARFADVEVALAAGYLPDPECAEIPGVGAMGFHYVNPALIEDGVVNPTKPEILLYLPTADGGRELVGVEYMTVDGDQDLATDDDRPKMMGHELEGPMPGHGPGMPVHYDLHAWVFADNPAGDLATWNPSLTCDVG